MSRFEVKVRRSAVGKSMGRDGRLSGPPPSETGIPRTWPVGGVNISWDGSAAGGDGTVWESTADESCSKSKSVPRSSVRERAELTNGRATVFPQQGAERSRERRAFFLLQISAVLSRGLLIIDTALDDCDFHRKHDFCPKHAAIQAVSGHRTPKPAH